MCKRNQIIEILWDGSSALAVHKPAGIPTQAAPGIESLETLLRMQLAERTHYIAFPHRLDRPVSGVLLVATRKRAARLLSEQFASQKVNKTYLAWVTGKVQPEQLGLWLDHLRKVPERSHSEVVEPDADGARVAETTAALRFYDSATDCSLLELSPRTGRMHQLRVQAAHRGYPIIGDRQYGGRPVTDSSNKALGENDDIAHRTRGTSSAPGSCDPNPEIGHLSEVRSHNAVPHFRLLDAKVSEPENNVRPTGRILLQAQQIKFHDPSNGVLRAVNASEELPGCVQ